MSLVTV